VNIDDALAKEIADVFGLLGVLLVFVIAFYTYLLTQAETLISQEVPAIQQRKTDLISKLTSTQRLLSALAASTAVVLLVLVPLGLRVVGNLLSHPDHFPTSQVGFVLIGVFLVVLVVAIGWLRQRVARRLRELR
jgi:uncharacterized membrane protein